MTKAEQAMEKVHTLYLLQFELFRFLNEDIRDEKTRKELKVTMKQFQQLLSQADWRYMGGEDVLEALKQLPQEITQKLKASPVVAVKKVTKKITAKKKSKK